ncbi:putative short-chain dehydrogenase [Xylariaceae sp. FL1272]|nr:putative short-chain dehydrogenase [Xylariaceae sp. FL1272]
MSSSDSSGGGASLSDSSGGGAPTTSGGKANTTQAGGGYDSGYEAGILLTGANSSAGYHAAEHLLKTYPEFTAIFTVRDASDSNTARLRDMVSRYPAAQITIHQLYLADLSSVHAFATSIAAGIQSEEYPPLGSNVCNANHWNLVRGPEQTVDKLDKTIQISHVSHVALVLRLLDSFAPNSSGRIVILSSIGYFRKKNIMSSIIPELPADLDELVHPPPVPEKERFERGYQRMANAKLLATTWMYPWNDYLSKSPKYEHISAVAVNPGGLADSRCFHTNTPISVRMAARFFLKPMMPVIHRLADPTLQSSSAAGVDMIELAVNKAHPDYRGYLTLLNKDKSDPITYDEDAQRRVWSKSAQWAGVTAEMTGLPI